MLTISKNNFNALKTNDKKQTYLDTLREYLKNSPHARFMTMFFITLAGLVICQQAIAFGTPAAGSFGYNVYDIAFNCYWSGRLCWRWLAYCYGSHKDERRLDPSITVCNRWFMSI